MSNKQFPMRLLNFKRASDNEEEKKDLDRERTIVIYMESKRVIFKINSIKSFAFILEKLSMPYFYLKGEKQFFDFDQNIKFFWSKINNKIIYEGEPNLFIDKENFFGFHKNLIPKNMKIYTDFCLPNYSFSEEEGEIFYNTLNEDAINKLKDTRYFEDKKIVRFFGTKKNGKSTLVYYYFAMRRYIPLSEMKSIDKIKDEKNTGNESDKNNILTILEKNDDFGEINNNNFFLAQNIL